MYKVDIITITKDNKSELIKTLDSLAQTSQRINKIIIVDDSVNNNEIELKEEFSKFYDIIYIYQKSNSIYSAFNMGLKQVKNDYIFINSGDWAIGDVFKNINSPGVLDSISFKCGKPKNILVQNNFMRFFNHQSIIFDKNFKEKFDEKYDISSDFDFYLRYCKKYGIPKPVNPCYGLICFSLGGISTKKKFKRDIEYLKIYIQHQLLSQFIIFLTSMFFKFLLLRYV